MKLQTEEIGIAIAALNTKADGSARTFQAIQLADVVSIMGQFKKYVNDEGLIPNGEHEVKFSTEEKKLLLDCIDEREWQAGDAEFVISIKEKLN